jgi:hypothetical protein
VHVGAVMSYRHSIPHGQAGVRRRAPAPARRSRREYGARRRGIGRPGHRASNHGTRHRGNRGQVSPQPMVMTTSLDSNTALVRTMGADAVMSMPISVIAVTAAGLISSASSVPAERTSMRSSARFVRSAAAIWDRPALCTQTKSTAGADRSSAVPLGQLRRLWEAAPKGERHVDQGALRSGVRRSPHAPT